METKFFWWKSWDQHGVGVFGFADIILKEDIGSHKAGEKLPYANLDFEKGVLELFPTEESLNDKNGPERYQLGLRVCERI